MTISAITIRTGTPLFKLSREKLEKKFKIRVLRKLYSEHGKTVTVEGPAKNIIRLNQEARG